MDERKRILELLAEGRINVDEAERLLEAVKVEERGNPAVAAGAAETHRQAESGAAKARFLRVLVVKEGGEKVNVRVPLSLLRAGIKLKGLLPDSARAKVDIAMQEKGLNFSVDDLDGKALDEIVQTLQETGIDVEGDGETVRVYCE